MQIVIGYKCRWIKRRSWRRYKTKTWMPIYEDLGPGGSKKPQKIRISKICLDKIPKIYTEQKAAYFDLGISILTTVMLKTPLIEPLKY